MAEETKADLMMSFRPTAGSYVEAESTLDVASTDNFLSDYETAPSQAYYSSFFEVASFDFTMNVKSKDDAVGALSRQPQAVTGRPSPQAEAFSRWRSAKEDEYRKIHYPVEFNEFRFSRLIDAASPTFFQACCNSTSFHSAALVKRVLIGEAGSTEVRARGYLRFDFRGVLLTGVDWSDGDLVQEQCTFICRAMRLRYKQQLVTGTLTEVVSTSIWPNPSGSLGKIEDMKLLAMVLELMQYG